MTVPSSVFLKSKLSPLNGASVLGRFSGIEDREKAFEEV